MNLRFSTVAKRALGVALATSMVAGGLANAATPAGTLDAEYDFRDAAGTAVLAVYPYSDTTSTIGYFRVKGPKASWLQSHFENWGFVGWRVIVRTAPTKSGPWTIDRKSNLKTMQANKTGALEKFAPRTIKFDQRGGKFFVKLTSKLVWFREDGNGPIAAAQRTYARYGLVVSSGILPEFGDEVLTRAVAPNIYPS